jgi:hypothetical protein
MLEKLPMGRVIDLLMYTDRMATDLNFAPKKKSGTSQRLKSTKAYQAS